MIGAVVFVYVGVSGAVAYQNVYAKSATTQSSVSPKTYSLNENGQTYGSDAYATSPETGPELISATCKDGIEGYVIKNTWTVNNPKRPKKPMRYRTVDHQVVAIFRFMT
ncbi:hypothetical protein CA600_06425 [Paenibacillus sp. VTT E-133280]|uniref:hypothetical protein n=1 Tax=Paenibacillus sp. VTT E-133280 TaxID=1986222 RepID=UPI000BA0854D|nr:hypothetical protein [Paenibacillus sp. VTT E-133280]OZQ68443.1 hypothetical protein CA600_06425 [Paenibacillus sp. VTT E-133280]